MKSMRAWIANVMSRLRRLFVRGRTQRAQEQTERARAPLGDTPREIEMTSAQQWDTSAGSVANSAIPPRGIMDPESGGTAPEVRQGSTPDGTSGKECASPGPSDCEATAPVTPDALEDEGVSSPIVDDSLRPGPARGPGSVVPDSQPSPSPPEAHPSETDTPGVTTSASAVESDVSQVPEGVLGQGGPQPERDPVAEQAASGAEFDDTPMSQVRAGGAGRADGEIATTPPPPSAAPSRRSRHVAPEQRGGRPRGTSGPADKAASATGAGDVGRVRSSLPELVCWKEGMAWVVGVEVPEELVERDLRVLDAAGNDLQEDGRQELHWRLKDPLGTVTVRWSDEAGMETDRCFEASNYRVFKLTRSGASGRYVERVTRGNYVVIAPQDLMRDESVGGTAPVAPENVIPEQARVSAHHLLVEGDADGLLLKGSGSSPIEIQPSAATRFQLIGNTIKDAHAGAGPLFGREPPRFRVEGAEEPSLFVVGVEGSSPGPRPRQAAVSFDELRDWLDDNEPGWFYVRAYDANDELLESLDFRYVKGLEAIEVDELSPLPGPEGHRPAKVVFRVAPSVAVTPVDGPPEIMSLDATPAEGVVLPARPEAGRSTWRLSAGTGNCVDVVVHVPRIWWALTASGNADEPHAWSDRLHMLSVDDLRPTSPMRLSVLLPEPGWADEVTVGFRDGSPRRRPVPRSERVLHYLLRNLGESDALRGAGGTCDLLVSARTPVTEHGPVVVATVQLTENLPKQERDGRLDLSRLRAPRLMSTLTQLGRVGTARDRRAVKRLRKKWYRKPRKSSPAETQEFVRRALALAAAWLEREPARRLPSQLQKYARSLSAQDPTAVASWQRWLRESEPRMGTSTDTGRGEVEQP